MNLREMMDAYSEEGLTRALAASRVCQDIVLKAISEGPLNRNVTIKGGVVMRSLTQNNRRATQDIDLDFIHYSLDDSAIRTFVQKLNCIDGITIEMKDKIKVLKHQDYHGKSIDDEGATLLKNTVEQSFVEKLRSLLKFGSNSRRYKDIYDMFYLKDIISRDKVLEIMDLLIFKDDGMFENTVSDIVKRVTATFKDEQYLKRVSGSRQRWMDNDIHEIADGIVAYLDSLK